MKTSFDKASKLFRRNVFLCTCYAFFLILLNGVNVLVCKVTSMQILGDFFGFTEFLLIFSLLIFVLFIVIGYEFFSAPEKNGLSEIFAVSDGGEKSLRLSQSVILLLLLSGVVLNIGIWGTVCYFKSGLSYLPYYYHLLKLFFLYNLMPGVIGALWGYILAFRFKRGKAYIMIIFLAFLGSPAAASAIGMLNSFLSGNVTVWFSRVGDLFAVMPYDLTHVPNFAYGFTAETYRYQGAFFIFFLLLGIILITYRNQSAKSYVKYFGIASVCVALVFAGFSVFNRGSVPLQDLERPDTAFYFRYNLMDTEQKEKPAEFEVSAYKMELKITNKLKADVKMTLKAEKPLDKYEFTLLDCYKIKSVEDGSGNPLEFERDSHYLTVYPQNTSEIPEIRIVYSGYNPITYTNNQGICLPGNFNYYPVEGFFVISKDGNECRFPEISERYFDVCVKTRHKNLISNLEKNEENRFVGKSNGLTLSAGFYGETEITVNGEKIKVYSAVYNLKYAAKNDKANIEKMQPYLDEYNKKIGCNLSWGSDGKTIMHLNSDSFVTDKSFSDHIICEELNPEETANELLEQSLPKTEEKLVIRELMMESLREGSIFFLKQSHLKDAVPERVAMAEIIIQKMNQNGEKAVYNAMYNYLTDETDTRSPEEFLKSL